MPEFIHVHSHTQFSLLDGAADIGNMMDKAVKDGMKAVTLTDHGNMFGAFKFVAEAEKRGIKGIVGCEFYIVDDHSRKDTKRPVRYHQLLLAKNQQGYKNLSKLCSIGFIDGMFGKFPCVDKKLIAQYSEGLIATSCCIGAEIPQAILAGDLEKAENLLRWWVDVFGEDYYVELQRHRGLENIDKTGISQEDINQQLILFARKYNLKLIATNDSHYVDEEDSFAHGILLCVNTGDKIANEKRFKFPSNDFYFKTQAQMSELFADVPEAIANTMEIYDKTYMPKLKQDIMLPSFQLPQGFYNQFDYLKFLAYQGSKARSRYGALTEEVKQRLDYELGIIQKMGFEGYFLIVQDFMNAAREMGVAVGPGRGSAAGSAVAFCLGITNIDPIKYKLLFERFLNPERVSMPDIDIDFDDYGRQDVIDWVVDKYGKNQVAQIITFGTMAAKSSIKDVARVLDLPLADSNRLAGYVPTKAGTKLAKLLNKTNAELAEEFDKQPEELENIKKLREIANQDNEEGKIIQQAKRLEGSARNTGIHAAGIIIAPKDLTECIPICTSKETELLVTQFDGSVVESAGMLKMDFLGLKTLSIIRDCIENIVLRYGEEARIDPDLIPFDDLKTMQLFQRGDTVGIFQFESPGMQKYLKELCPTHVEDLIAMNALYRPGPMDYIPSFIARKAGKEKIEYPHEWLEPILKDTYGIMVYQEQIMQAAQVMAGYSLGQADILRRAMGKKKKEEMDKQSATFIAGATQLGVSEAQAVATFEIMTKFAAYGFNRSHSAAYSVVAYQTAYLKANYPAEYMASVLTHNRNSTEDVNFFLSESKAQGISVLNPDINESNADFTVNKEGKIRFGLSALKGVGEGMVEEILAARKNNPFKTIGDFVRRVNAKVVNKKCMEALAYSGAFDSWGINRSQFFHIADKENYISVLSAYASSYHKQLSDTRNSLFGASSMENMIKEPLPPKCEEWGLMEKLKKEQEVMGIFLSGHPLNDYQLEYKRFATPMINIEQHKDKTVVIAGVVTSIEHRTSQKGTGFGKIVLEDYEGKMELMLFSENYLKFKNFMEPDAILCVKGKYKKSWKGDSYEFAVEEIRLLESVGHDKMRQITLKICLEELNEKLIQALDKLTQRYRGEKLLAVQLYSENAQLLPIDYIAFKRKIDINNALAQDLERLLLKYTVH